MYSILGEKLIENWLFIIIDDTWWNKHVYVSYEFTEIIFFLTDNRDYIITIKQCGTRSLAV